jgi:CRP-like cAMP-binding protein
MSTVETSSFMEHFCRVVIECTRNQLLATLRDREWEMLASQFDRINVQFGQILFSEEEPLHRIYFPIDCLISTVAIFESGTSVEVATTGNEGLVPFCAILGYTRSLTPHVVQIGGSSLVMPFEDFQRNRRERIAFRMLTDAYGQAFLAKLLRSIACNAVHSVEQRAARWLLMCHDRAGADTFPLTQEVFAEFLGVARPTVNVVSRHLKQAGIISYGRGRITVESRKELEASACECYGIIRQHYKDAFSNAITELMTLAKGND